MCPKTAAAVTLYDLLTDHPQGRFQILVIVNARGAAGDEAMEVTLYENHLFRRQILESGRAFTYNLADLMSSLLRWRLSGLK